MNGALCMRKITTLLLTMVLSVSLITACTYNPFTANNHLTGSPTGAVVGGVATAGVAALLGLPKPIIVLLGLGGAGVGYYTTTLRYDSGGIIQGGGKVYRVGRYLGIYIPTDNLFEPNSTDFIPQARFILASTATVLKRYPYNRIIVSGNMAGFGRPRWDQVLSEQRAAKIAAYLWSAGIADKPGLMYVGDGDFFPIAADFTNDGIRANERIQITSYPPECPFIRADHIRAFDDFDHPNP